MSLFLLSMVLLCTSASCATALYDSLEDTEEDVSDLYHYLDKDKKPVGSLDHYDDIESIDNAESIIKSWQSAGRYEPLTEADNSFIESLHANKQKIKTGDLPDFQEDILNMYGKNKYPEEPTSYIVPSVNDFNDVERKRAIRHLKKISSVQSDIVEMLKRIESSSRKNKNCSAQNVQAQQAAIAEMEMSLDLPLDESLLLDRASRSIDIQSLRNQFALAKKKRSRVLQLMQELNQFKDIQLSDMETDSIISAVNALKHKVCAEVAQEARELAEISKHLQTGVLEKRKHVLKLLADLLLDSNIAAEATTKKDQTIVVKIPSSPESEKSVKNDDLDDSSWQHLIDSITLAESAKKNSPVADKQNSQSVKQAVESSSTVSTRREGKQRVAGRVNLDRCQRCEDLDEEEVCGGNGQTYRTLCHAINCAGLALKDISVGSCMLKNVCAHSKCSDLEICVPMDHAACLTLYSSDGLVRLPCHRYRCSKPYKPVHRFKRS